MVKGHKNFETGLALLSAIAMVLFLTTTVAIYFSVVQQKIRQVYNYTGKLAAKWTIRSGVYIAEEIMRNAEAGPAGITESYTVIGTTPRTPTGMDLPSYVTARSGFYSVTITRPSDIWGSADPQINVTLSSDTIGRDITLTVESPSEIFYKGNLFNYEVEAQYHVRYMSDYALYIAQAPENVYGVSNIDADDSLGIFINGMWNIYGPGEGEYVTIEANEIVATGYIRALSDMTISGTDDAGVNYAPWLTATALDGSYTGEIRITGPTGQTGELPHDLFRLDDGGYSYLDTDFETDAGAVANYKRDLNYWLSFIYHAGWWVRDRTSGVQPMPMFSTAERIAMYSARSNQLFDIEGSLGGGGAPLSAAALKDAAQAVAGEINTEYGAPVATGRAIVNILQGDNVEAAVEIDMSLLAPLITEDNNKIHIRPSAETDIWKLSVVLINAEDISPNEPMSFFVEGSVYTHGNVNTNTSSPPLTIVARDEQYTLSSPFPLRKIYLGPDAIEESGRAEYGALYIAENLNIINPTYATYIHSEPGCDTFERSLKADGRDATNPSDETIYPLSSGQYWLYDDAGNPTTTPNPYYPKRLDELDPTGIPIPPPPTTITLNTLNVNPVGWPIMEFESRQNVTIVYNGSLGIVDALGNSTFNRRNMKFSSSNPNLNNWLGRTNGGTPPGFPSNPYYSSTHSQYLYYDTGTHEAGVFTYEPTTGVDYNNNLLTTHPALLFDGLVRQTWREGLRR